MGAKGVKAAASNERRPFMGPYKTVRFHPLIERLKGGDMGFRGSESIVSNFRQESSEE
jgi:hypothetical protein